METFGNYMRRLRKTRGLTLKQVETQAKVSNAYISQIERGLRNPPHPEILKRLAKTYNVEHRELLVAAGYLEEDSAEAAKRRTLEKAFEHVQSDPAFKHGTRLKGTHVSLETKRFIVEMYEKLTNRNLLKGA
ncbi:MAG: helix-turn-helix domain-containing protein, partial [Acidobacteriia bacterium]|nr:helix-turn-helix domain-containing protein [Terriglobia bacterium]